MPFPHLVATPLNEVLPPEFFFFPLKSKRGFFVDVFVTLLFDNHSAFTFQQ